MMRLKVKDFIFLRYFLQNEIDLPVSSIADILDKSVEVMRLGEPDRILVQKDKIVYYNPSSTLKFLFNILYTSLSSKLVNDYYKDKLGLALLGMCREHVYADYDRRPIANPPVIVSFEKLDVAQFFLSEIIEPLIGKVRRMPVFFFPCKFTDVCRVVESRDQLTREYDLSYQAVPVSDYPIILTNSSVYNSAARMCHLITTLLRYQYSEEQFRNILKSVLVDSSSKLMSNLITIIKTLRSEPLFVLDFMKYINSEINDESDRLKAEDSQMLVIANDKFLSRHIKIADLGNPIGNQQSQVFRQWTQWSMMLGLIEKQLIPMRGSLWPTTENLKPFEDRRKKMIADREEKKGSPLNFEELLEIARDEYNHNAKPGSLIETLLKNNRVWKA